MTEYGVQTTNIFDLLSEEGPSKAAPKKAADAAAAPAAAGAQKKGQQGQQAKPAAGQAAAAQKKPAQAQQGKPASGQVAGKGPARDGGKPAREGQVRPAREGQAPRRDGAPGEGRRERPAGERGPRVNNGERGPRRTEGGGGRREGGVVVVDGETRQVRERPRDNRRDRPVKDRGDANAPNYEGRRPARGRVFERHSGTGRDPTENKKGGAGKSNWGAAGKDDLAAVIDAAAEPAAADDKEAAEAAPADAAPAAADAAEAEAKGKDKEAAAAAPVEEDPDDLLITFDEYQKQQKKEAAAARKKFKQPKARSAGEGVKLDPKWANAVPLKREEETSVLPIAAKPKKEAKETKDGQPQVQQTKKAAPKEKTISAADILRFEAPRRGEREGGRGGRGGFNREGGRGGFGGRGGRRDGAPSEGGARRPRREGEGSPAQAPRADAPKREAKAAPAPAISDAAQFPALGQ